MSKEARSALVWLTVFLVVELAAVFWSGCPWSTFTDTVRGALQWWHLLAVWVTVLFVILYGHFVYDWRARYLIAWGLVGLTGVVVHLLLHDG